MFPLEEVAKLGYNVFYHGQKSHYGVALLTKETPIAVRRGFPVTTRGAAAVGVWQSLTAG